MVSKFGIFYLFGDFYVTFNTVQVISRRVVGRAEETSTYSLSGFCTVNCRPTASNYQLSHLRPCLRGGRQECYHSATVAPKFGILSVAISAGSNTTGGNVDRVSVPSPIAFDILMDTMARGRAHMYLFSVQILNGIFLHIFPQI